MESYDDIKLQPCVCGETEMDFFISSVYWHMHFERLGLPITKAEVLALANEGLDDCWNHVPWGEEGIKDWNPEAVLAKIEKHLRGIQLFFFGQLDTAAIEEARHLKDYSDVTANGNLVGIGGWRDRAPIGVVNRVHMGRGGIEVGLSSGEVEVTLFGKGQFEIGGKVSKMTKERTVHEAKLLAGSWNGKVSRG